MALRYNLSIVPSPIYIVINSWFLLAGLKMPFLTRSLTNTLPHKIASNKKAKEMSKGDLKHSMSNTGFIQPFIL